MPEKESLSLRGESSANRRLGGFHGVRPFSIPIVPFDQIEPGVFRAPFVFEAEGPMGWQSGSGDLELELDGELAARIEFVTFDGFKST